MTDEKATGGPAFSQESRPYHSGAEGMSLRDWFAGQALMGITSGYWACENMTGIEDETIACFAYEQADAMLKARDK